jgi:flagellar protein FliS
MRDSRRASYVQTQVDAADPVELVKMLYRGAIDSSRQARLHLMAGEIAERSTAITKAMLIVGELGQSLDRDRGGEVGLKLAQLYDFCSRKLVEANVQQKEAPLTEVEQVLTTLLEAWEQCSCATQPEAVVEDYEPLSISA